MGERMAYESGELWKVTGGSVTSVMQFKGAAAVTDCGSVRQVIWSLNGGVMTGRVIYEFDDPCIVK